MCHKGMCGSGCVVMCITAVLLVIGGLNWGLVGIGMLMGSDLNVVAMLLGAWPALLAIVYLLVGVAAVVKIFGCHCQKCKACEVAPGQNMGGNM